jgi:uncharacterized iron-regulated protein
MILGWTMAALCLGASTIDFTASQQKILQELLPANIIYLGEVHDRSQDHQDQLAIIQYLYQKSSHMAIGLEMFQKPYQGSIDRYLTGQISESELIKQTEYQQRWGFPWENYAPLLRFAKEHQLPIIALNAPTETTRKIAKKGLKSLTPEDFRYIPPIKDIDKSNVVYRQLIQESYSHHQSVSNSPGFEKFHEAQLVWDETMASNITDFHQQHPRDRIIVIAGQAHIKGGHGIPDRVARRLATRQLIQKSVLLSSNQEPEPASTDLIFR